MKLFIKYLLFIYVFTISWTNAFAISALTPIYVISLSTIFFSGSIFLLYNLESFKKPRGIFTEDIFLYILIVWLFFISIINNNAKTINYLLVYIFVFFIGIIFLKLLVLKIVSAQDLLKANFYGIIFLSIFLVLEFVINNVLNSDILEIIPGYSGRRATYLGLYFRNFGLAEEPGYISFYYVVLAPLAYRYILLKEFCKKAIIFYTSVMFLGFLSLLSAGGIGIFLISKITNDLILSFLRKKIRIKKIMLSLILLLSLFFIKNNEFVAPIWDKLTLASSEGSAVDRQNRWERDFTELINENYLIGKGLGKTAVDDIGSSTNWYLFLANEAGLIATFLVFIYLISSYIRILKSNLILEKKYYLYGFLSGVIYFFIISTIQLMPLWLLLVIYTMEYLENTHTIFEKETYAFKV